MLPLWLRKPLGRRAKLRKRGPPVRRAFCLQAERLEDRRLLATVKWIGGSGDWNTPANWEDDTLPIAVNRLPAAEDDAVIDVADVSVTHSIGSHTVKSLTINDPFTLSGGTLIVTGNLVQQNAKPFTMTGGRLASAMVVGGGGAVLAVSGGTLDGVTLGATIDGVSMAATIQSSSNFSVTGGLTFANGSVVDLGNQMSVIGDQTLGGDGEIRFRGAFSAIFPSGQTTFGPGLTVHRSDAGSATSQSALAPASRIGGRSARMPAARSAWLAAAPSPTLPAASWPPMEER
jgi:hypothetical protein